MQTQNANERDALVRVTRTHFLRSKTESRMLNLNSSQNTGYTITRVKVSKNGKIFVLPSFHHTTTTTTTKQIGFTDFT